MVLNTQVIVNELLDVVTAFNVASPQESNEYWSERQLK